MLNVYGAAPQPSASPPHREPHSRSSCTKRGENADTDAPGTAPTPFAHRFHPHDPQPSARPQDCSPALCSQRRSFRFCHPPPPPRLRPPETEPGPTRHSGAFLPWVRFASTLSAAEGLRPVVPNRGAALGQGPPGAPQHRSVPTLRSPQQLQALPLPPPCSVPPPRAQWVLSPPLPSHTAGGFHFYSTVNPKLCRVLPVIIIIILAFLRFCFVGFSFVCLFVFPHGENAVFKKRIFKE